ncbi:MAG: TIGR03118 family protein [Acidobacteriota bacterium]
MRTLLRHAACPVLALSLIGAMAFGQNYNVTSLKTNMTDPNLLNPWGLARGSGTPWWVSDNRTGLATVYTGNGTEAPLMVTIPGAKPGVKGTPTGIMYNGSKTDFLIGGTPALYLFCTLDGTIQGWTPGAKATMPVVKTTDGSSFTGLTSAMVGMQRRLYVANFTKGRVDMYDNMFHSMAKGEGLFEDDQLPPDYVPYNVQAIGNDIVVTYALHEEGNLFETDGPGFGYVDIYSSNGKLIQRLKHGDWLNAPWGVALAPLDFGTYSHDLLVGQFAGGGMTDSSGYIAAYDMVTGRFKGLLEDASGNPLQINGIWAISFGNRSPNNYDLTGAPAAEMYFTAGPNHASGGQFGFVTPVSNELIQGSGQ